MFETSRVRAQQPDTSDISVIVLGMGNIGSGAYDAMTDKYGDRVLGVDDNDRKLERCKQEGRRVAQADASDPDFWREVNLDEIKLIMLALTNHQENMLVGHLLDDLGYKGQLAAVVRFAEDAEELEEQGISTYNLFVEAGAGFADHAAVQLQKAKSPGQS